MFSAPIFRKEALQAYLKDPDAAGALKASAPWTWWILVSLGGFLLVFLSLAALLPVELTERGAGVLRPEGGIRLIQAPRAGHVLRVQAHAGDPVRAGAPLLEVETSQLQGARVESEAKLSLLQTDFRTVASQQDGAYQEQVQVLDARIQALTENQHSYTRSLEAAERQVKAKRDLAEAGYIGRFELDSALERLEEVRRTLRTAEIQIQQVRQERRALEATRSQQLFSRKSELAQASSQRAALDINLKEGALRAPVDGHVDGMVVREGDRVEPGQVLAKLVAAGTPLHVVAFLPEKARAFLREGDPVRIELNQFPYAEFGTLPGRIKKIGQDLASPHEWSEALGSGSQAPQPGYRVEIVIQPAEKGALTSANLKPGMLLQVRYTLRRQSLLALALAPLRQWLS